MLARSDREGLSLLNKSLPDLILCANSPPEIRAYSLLNNIRNNPDTKVLPFVLIGTDGDPKAFREALSHGANNYLFKPLKIIHLLQTTDILLEKSSNPNPRINTPLTIDRLFIKSEISTFRKNATVYLEGSAADNFYYIHKGLIKLSVKGCCEKEAIVKLVSQGEYFGYEAFSVNLRYRDTAKALEDTEVLRIEQNVLRTTIAENRQLFRYIIDMLAEEVARYSDMIGRRAYYSIRKQVALELLHRTRHSYNPIKITRETLAKIIGASTESVIRVISELKKEKLIEASSEGIKILDQKSLEKIQG